MKRTISIILAVIMLLCTLGSISAFAAEEKYTPLESGDYNDANLFKNYQYNIIGYGSELFSLDDVDLIQTNFISYEQTLEEDVKTQIQNDTGANFDYFGTLSDGSVLIRFPVFYVDNIPINYMVIGNYLYISGNVPGHEVVIYKDHKSIRIVDAYKNGDISEDVLDEIAELLCFAKFVKRIEQPSTEPGTTEPTLVEAPTNSVSTPDTSAYNNSGDTSASNNENGSIPTGQNNVAVILSVLILCVSVAVFLISKGKKKFL